LYQDNADVVRDPQNLITKPGFIDILRIFTDSPNQATEKVPPLDSFGTFITLHGLINVNRDQRQIASGIGNFHKTAVLTSLEITNSESDMRSQAESTQERDGCMELALDAWRASTQGQYTGNPSTINASLSSDVLFRIAHITLHTSVIDLQVLAGIDKVMGKPVTPPAKYDVLKRTITRWANSEGAVKSVHHALELLSETVFQSAFYLSTSAQTHDPMYGRLQSVEHALDVIVHGKWCLYLATLTLWAWGALTAAEFWREGTANGMSEYIKTEGGLHETRKKDDQTVWNNAQSYLKAMLAISRGNQGESLMTSPWRLETRGLIIVTRNLLHSERWELRIFLLTMAYNNSTTRIKTLDEYPERSPFIVTANFDMMNQANPGDRAVQIRKEKIDMGVEGMALDK